MNLIITITFILIIAYLATRLGSKIKIPTVISLILCGLILDIPFLKSIFIEPNTEFIFNLGNIALICLMFLAGLESSWKLMYKERKDALFIATFASFVSFLFGFMVFKILGFSYIVSFVVGVCMSITAEATKAKVLFDLKKLKTRMGAAMMGAGIIDDILGLSFFILITSLIGVVSYKENILLTLALLSFFLGIVVQSNIGRKHAIITNIEKLLILLIIPFFFVSVGLHFDMESLVLNPLILIAMIVVGVGGKFLGTFLTKPFTKFNYKQLHLIGWAMNSRGAVEMALALIAFKSNIIPIEIYSNLIIMALLTTLIFPFVITKTIKKNPKIMD